MTSLLKNNAFVVVYREDFKFQSHVVCLIDVKDVTQSVERLTNVKFSPENIDHLPSEMIHRVTTDFLCSCLSTIEKMDRSELHVKRLRWTVQEIDSISQKVVDSRTTKSKNSGEATLPLPLEYSDQNIHIPNRRLSDGSLPTELDSEVNEVDTRSRQTVIDVDDQQNLESSQASPPTVTNVDTCSYQKVAHAASCQPMAPVDCSCPVARVDNCQQEGCEESRQAVVHVNPDGGQIVARAASCQPLTPVDSCHPVNHMDSCQTVTSPDNSQLETADQIFTPVDGGQSVKSEPDMNSGKTCMKRALRRSKRSAGLSLRKRKYRGYKKRVTATSIELDEYPITKHSRTVSDQQKQKPRVAKKIQRGVQIKAEKKCSVCSKEFTSNHNLANHMRTHTGERCFQCEVCGMAFTLRKTMKHHIKAVHAKEKPFKCSMCGKSFPIKVYLNSHMRVHTGERPHICEVCGRSFSLKSGLKQHIRVHTNEKPYKCEICGKGFGQRGGLIKHFSGHEERKQFWYKCELCDKTFPVKEKFLVHKRLHTGEKPYLCDNCGKGFASSAYLAQHRKMHNRRTYQCTNCGRSYSWAHTLQQHSKTCVMNTPLSVNIMDNVLLQPPIEMASHEKPLSEYT